MKKFLLVFLVSFSLFAQNETTSKPNLSLLSLNKLNIVYKGLSNPFTVNVKDAKPFIIKGDDVVQNNDGSYYIKPKSNAKETKVFVEINTTDSTKVSEEHIFRVKDLPYAALLVNQKGCINSECTIDMPVKDLMNAQVTVKLIDFLLDYEIKVIGFRLYLTNTKGETLESYDIDGNKIPEDVYEDIVNNDKANLIIIHKINFTSDLGLSIAKTPLIRIRKIKE
ncbi:MAG: GldM family protein [Limnohabitans sp.]|nr:GldM family protein [Limnohabitans sp.]